MACFPLSHRNAQRMHHFWALPLAGVRPRLVCGPKRGSSGCGPGEMAGAKHSAERSNSAQTRIDRDFPGKSTTVSWRFCFSRSVTRQKQRYLQRQHNMLCFILDTPHRGRYFHDCVTIVRNESAGSSGLHRLKSTSAEPNSSETPRGPDRPLNTQHEVDCFEDGLQLQPKRAVPGIRAVTLEVPRH